MLYVDVKWVTIERSDKGVHLWQETTTLRALIYMPSVMFLMLYVTRLALVSLWCGHGDVFIATDHNIRTV